VFSDTYPLWERSDRAAILVRGYGLSIDLTPSPQPSPASKSDISDFDNYDAQLG
jgi:hypothetical protein